MAFVDNCPTILHKINMASKRLGCGHDLYGNDQYICVPNVEKTSLVELCYDGIMGIQKKGRLKLNTTPKRYCLPCFSFLAAIHPYNSITCTCNSFQTDCLTKKIYFIVSMDYFKGKS